MVGWQLSFFKVLVVFQRTPAASPCKSVLCKQAVGKVVAINLVFQLFASIGILAAFLGVDNCLSVGAVLYVGVVKRVEVNGFSHTVLRQFLRACYCSVVEARRVVMIHRCHVVGVVVVNQLHALNGVVGIIQFAEYLNQIVGYVLMTNHLASHYPSVSCVVQQLQIAQLGAWQGAVGFVRLSVYACKELAVYCLLAEVMFKSVFLDFCHAYGLSGLPMLC